MKRITVLLTAITIFALLLTGCTNVTDGAEKTTDAVTTGPIIEANPAEDFEYTENEDGNIVIKRYVGDVADVVIPETIDGKTVTKIGGLAFAYNKKLVSVVIPDTVTVISAAVFQMCTELTTVNLPEGLIEIGPGAFEECVKVSGITLPSGLTELGYRAFYNCKALTHIIIPKTLVGKDADEVGGWQAESFVGAGLQSIDFEDGVESIAYAAFAGTNITEVVLPSSVRNIYSSAFLDCNELSSVQLNEGLERIDSYAFGGNTKLTEIVIPSTVTDITEMTFSNSTTIESVIFKGDAPEGYITQEEYGTYLIPSVPKYTIYYSSDSEGFTSPVWNGYKSAEIGTECAMEYHEDLGYVVNSNGEAVIYDYIGTEPNVVIPSHINDVPVVSIGMNAFFCNSVITSVTIPETVRSIEDRAFYCCENLSNVELNDGLESIGTNAFFTCNKISQITLPGTLTSLGDVAFSNCSMLKHVNIPKGVVSWGNNVFAYAGLETIDLEAGLQSIGEGAFYGTKIQSVEIPSSVTDVPESAFEDCSNLQEITYE